MHPTIMEQLAEARLTEMRNQAERDRMARDARRARPPHRRARTRHRTAVMARARALPPHRPSTQDVQQMPGGAAAGR
jgi:hypothetical protein